MLLNFLYVKQRIFILSSSDAFLYDSATLLPPFINGFPVNFCYRASTTASRLLVWDSTSRQRTVASRLRSTTLNGTDVDLF